MRTPMRDGPNPKSWLGLALVLAGAAACSVDPLIPESTDSDGGMAGQGGGGGTSAQGGTTGGGGTTGDGACAGLPIPAIACAVGRTVIRLHDGRGRPGRLDDHLPRRSDGQRRRRWWRGRRGWRERRGRAAAHSLRLLRRVRGGRDLHDRGRRLQPPPGCGAGLACPAVCYGTCRPANDGPACGTVRCAAGMVCCNDSCGTCTPPNGGCTKQICVPPAGTCARDADCRLEADYCTGCDCRALAANQKLPVCQGPGVACLIDPCGSKKAQCVNGACAVVP